MKKLLTIALLAASLTSCMKDDQAGTRYQVNEATSKAEWKGSAPDHFHVGSFKVTGTLAAGQNGIVRSGDFVIPISSIQDYDLPDPVRQQLLSDLRDNFFKIAVNPNAGFHLTKAEAYTKADTSAIAGANYLLTGDFTMAGQTHPVSFPAKVTVTSDSLKTEAKFNIDRNKWGITNYNDPAQALYILPNVNIHLNVQAGKGK